MLEQALRARLPLIAVDTDDVLNVVEVLTEVAGEEPRALLDGFSAIKENSLYYMMEPAKVAAVAWYRACSEANSTIVLINPHTESKLVFDGGTLITPTPMIEAFVDSYYEGDKREMMISAFMGMTLKDIKEIARLAMATYKELTPDSVTKVRRQYFGSVAGLEQVECPSMFYMQSKALIDWLDVDGRLLMNSSSPKELVPRGLLFTGGHGTGKTMGAKHIAKSLELPLYLLNLGALSSKYFSESEKHMARCLQQAENSAPCVLLIDEAEKLFAHTEDSGTSARLLAHLLWWLQEHNGKVLTIMTTNDESIIPPELWREGRIDKKLEFLPLGAGKGRAFISGLAAATAHLHTLSNSDVIDLWESLYIDDDTTYSHAALAARVMDKIKRNYLLKH